MLIRHQLIFSSLIAVLLALPSFATDEKPADLAELNSLEQHVFLARPSEALFAQLVHFAKGHPTSARVHYILGIAYAKSGFIDLAQEQFNLVKSEDPRFTRQMVQRFKDDLERRDYVANTTALFARQVEPECPEILFLDGLNDRVMGRYDSALAKFEKVARRGTHISGLATAMANVYLIVGQYGPALKLVQADGLHKPPFFETEFVKGITLTKLHRYKEALEPLQMAYNQRPGVPETRLALIESLLKTGRSAETIEPYLVDLAYLSSPARARQEQQELAGVIRLLPVSQICTLANNAAAKVTDDNCKPKVYFALSDIYDNSQDFAASCQVRAIGLRLVPSYADGYYRMAEDLANLRLFAQAAQFYAKAQKLDPLDRSGKKYGARLRRAEERGSNFNNDLAAQVKDWLHQLLYCRRL